MSTLHLCHWQSQEHLKQHLSLVTDDDSLIIYGKLDHFTTEFLHSYLSKLSFSWYLLIDPSQTNNHRIINHDTWLELLISHNNSFAWK